MELWFLMTVIAALASGIGSFTLKVVAKHGYDSELYIFYSAVFSILLSIPIALVVTGWHEVSWWALLCAFVGGIVAAVVGIMKVYALRYIDTTIYFPLYKLLSPLLVIIGGVFLFVEQFSLLEWIGLIMGLLVPLLLITPAEHRRQNNLLLGLVLVGITGVLSALVAIFNKYAVDLSGGDVYWISASAALGIALGATLVALNKRGWHSHLRSFREHTTKRLLWVSWWRSLLMCTAFVLYLYGLSLGGELGIVYTIYSLSILVPIIMAIFYYKEHWNVQKVAAIVLSVAALALLH